MGEGIGVVEGDTEVSGVRCQVSVKRTIGVMECWGIGVVE